MTRVETRVAFTLDGQTFEYVTHQQVELLLPFAATLAVSASYSLASYPMLAAGRVTLLVITSDQNLSVQLNGHAGSEATLNASGIYVLTNFQGAAATPPLFRNLSATTTANVLGVFGGFSA